MKNTSVSEPLKKKPFKFSDAEQNLIEDIRLLSPENIGAVAALIRHLKKPGGVARLSLRYVCAACSGRLGGVLIDPDTNAMLCRKCYNRRMKKT